METDLQAVLRKGGLLKDIHRRYILCQLLRATKFLHSGGVIHRDQKPSNVLLDADCFVKLCDFGLARSLGQIQADEGGPPLTEYVATRWYRAPEILLASRRYTEGVDMWSLGCILGEMLLGKPLFPGSSTLNQIEQILRVVAPSSPEDVGTFHSDYSASIISRMGGQQRVSFEELLPASTPPEALDLLKRLLVFNPEKRLTAEEALQHPYVQRFHCPAKEPALRSNVILPLDDNVQLSVAEYRNKLYEMILEKKAQRRQRQRQEENLPAAPPPEARAHCEPEPAQGPFPPPTSPGPLGATIPCAAAPRRTSKASSPGPRPKGSLAPSHLARNRSAPLHPQPQQPQEAAASFSRRPRRQGSCPQTSATGTAAAAGGVLPPHSLMPWETNERSLASRPLSLSAHAHQAALHHPLMRKEPSPSKVAVAAGGNLRSSEPHSREALPPPPFQKPCKKLFQGTANVGAAGDPKACLGSYSQSYGTICQSALQSLPVASLCSQEAAP